jgi:hypothetical protein
MNAHTIVDEGLIAVVEWGGIRGGIFSSSKGIIMDIEDGDNAGVMSHLLELGCNLVWECLLVKSLCVVLCCVSFGFVFGFDFCVLVFWVRAYGRGVSAARVCTAGFFSK